MSFVLGTTVQLTHSVNPMNPTKVHPFPPGPMIQGGTRTGPVKIYSICSYSEGKEILVLLRGQRHTRAAERPRLVYCTSEAGRCEPLNHDNPYSTSDG